MKTEQYKLDYWIEVIQSALGEADLPLIPKDKEVQIAEAIIISVDNQSMAFGYVDTRGSDSYEVTSLKKQLADARKESEEWQQGFVNNVAMRHPNWDKHEISISKDGSASIRY